MNYLEQRCAGLVSIPEAETETRRQIICSIFCDFSLAMLESASFVDGINQNETKQDFFKIWSEAISEKLSTDGDPI